MKVTLENRKWQILSLVLAAALAISVGFNFYQFFNSPEIRESMGDMIVIPMNAMNYTFTWGPEAQDIVDGTFKIEVFVWFENRTSPWDNTTTEIFSILINVYDDDYSGGDYLGLVLDENHNGIIDYGRADRPRLLYARNSTTEAGLSYTGLVVPAQFPETNLYACTYDPEKGYVFYGEARASEITTKFGDQKSYIPIHICFRDTNVVFPNISCVSFQFRIYLKS